MYVTKPHSLTSSSVTTLIFFKLCLLGSSVLFDYDASSCGLAACALSFNRDLLSKRPVLEEKRKMKKRRRSWGGSAHASFPRNAPSGAFHTPVTEEYKRESPTSIFTNKAISKTIKIIETTSLIDGDSPVLLVHQVKKKSWRLMRRNIWGRGRGRNNIIFLYLLRLILDNLPLTS